MGENMDEKVLFLNSLGIKKDLFKVQGQKVQPFQ